MSTNKKSKNNSMESEERLRLALKASGLGMYDWNCVSNEVFWDDKMYALFELPKSSRKDAGIDLNEYFLQIVHEDDKEQVNRMYEEIFDPSNKAVSLNSKYRVVLNKKIKFIETHGFIFKDKQGKPTRILGTCLDITDQMASKEALIRSEKLFRSIVDDQTDMIIRWDLDGVRTFANKAYCERFNLKPEEAVGTSFFPLVTEEYVKNLKEKLNKLTPENPVNTMLHRLTLRDGSTGWQEWTDRAFFDENGEAFMYQSVGRDVTHLVEIRESLEASLYDYKSILQQASDGIFIADEKKNILIVNPSGCSLLGYSEEELLGKNLVDLVDPEDLAARPSMEKELKTKGTLINERVLLHKDGRRVFTEISSSMLDDGRMQLIVRDIEERKNAEEKLLFYGHFLESSLNEVYSYNVENLKFATVNDAAINSSGYQRNELLELTPLHIKPKFTKTQFEELVKPLIEGKKEKIVYQTQHKRKDGTQYDVEIHIQLVAHDFKIYLTEFVCDISQRKKSEARNKAFVEAIPDVIFIVDRDGKFIDYQNSSELETYTSPDFFIGKKLEEVLPIELANVTLSNIRKTLSKEKLEPHVYALDYPDGRRHFEARYARITAREVLLIVRDISGDVASKLQLKNSEQRLSLIFNSSTNNLTFFEKKEKHFVVTEMNEVCKATMRFAGLNENECYGQTLKVFLSSLNSSHLLKFFNEAAKTAEIITFTTSLEGEEGYRHFRSVIRPITNKGNTVTGMLVISIDITSEHDALLEIQSTKDRLSLIYDSTTDLMGLLKVDEGKFTTVMLNKLAKSTFKKLGLEAKDYMNKEIDEIHKKIPIVDEAYINQTMRLMKEVKKTGIVKSRESHTIGANGEKNVAIVKYIPVFEHKKCTHILWTSQDVTVERKYQDQLAKSQEELLLIFNNTEEMLGLVEYHDPDWIYTTINSATIRTLEKLGISEDEFVGSSAERVGQLFFGLEGEGLYQWLQNYETVRKTKEKIVFETKRENKLSGGFVYSMISFIPILDASGSCNRILYVARNVTDERVAQERLEKSEHQLSMIFNSTTDGMGLFEVREGSLYLVSVNQTATDSFTFAGLEQKSYLDKKAEHVFKLLGLSHIYESMKEVPNTGKMYETEDSLGTEENLRHFLFRYIPIFDETRSCTHVLGVTTDITDLRRAQIDTKESEERFARLAAATTEGISITQKGIIKDANPQLMQMMRCSKEELMGKPLWNFVQLDQREEAFAKVRSGESGPYELQFERLDGTTFFAEIKSTFTTLSGKEALIFAIYDITDRIESNRKLAESLKEIEQLKEKLEEENVYLREQIEGTFSYEDMVYSSSEFHEMLQNLEKVATTDATVLIQGETGTGKELIARAVHNISDRKAKPLIKVNCAAIPKDLIESELFGHLKGAFTGATQDKPGKFELAEGGTIFLDEIGELPVSLQPKLLRALQEKEIERVGGTSVKMVDVRVIAATNKNLKQAVSDGDFREDLYFRLDVFPIYVPSLRDRRDDIQVLIEHFVIKYAKKYKKSIKFIPDDVLEQLKAYDWPGNVRELENIIERSVILSNEDSLFVPNIESKGKKVSLQGKSMTLGESQRNYILKVLKECNWKIEGKGGAAKVLDIKPSTLRDKMVRLNISRPD